MAVTWFKLPEVQHGWPRRVPSFPWELLSSDPSSGRRCSSSCSWTCPRARSLKPWKNITIMITTVWGQWNHDETGYIRFFRAINHFYNRFCGEWYYNASPNTGLGQYPNGQNKLQLNVQVFRLLSEYWTRIWTFQTLWRPKPLNSCPIFRNLWKMVQNIHIIISFQNLNLLKSWFWMSGIQILVLSFGFAEVSISKNLKGSITELYSFSLLSITIEQLISSVVQV